MSVRLDARLAAREPDCVFTPDYLHGCGWPHDHCDPAIPTGDALEGVPEYDIFCAKWDRAWRTYLYPNDGLKQADRRVFPINPCQLTCHRHPGGRCPSWPPAAMTSSSGVLLPSLGQQASFTLEKPGRPPLILLRGGLAA